MKAPAPYFFILFSLWMTCCSSSENAFGQQVDLIDGDLQEITDGVAAVTKIEVSDEENQYTFSVTIASPDLGCQQYADWWEVIDTEGNLIYRRILSHSHVNEQPFTRTGTPVEISSTMEVYIRAHMNTTSYGSKVFKGSVAEGFHSENLDVAFAKDLEKIAPLPARCDF